MLGSSGLHMISGPYEYVEMGIWRVSSVTRYYTSLLCFCTEVQQMMSSVLSVTVKTLEQS